MAVVKKTGYLKKLSGKRKHRGYRGPKRGLYFSTHSHPAGRPSGVHPGGFHVGFLGQAQLLRVRWWSRLLGVTQKVLLCCRSPRQLFLRIRDLENESFLGKRKPMWSSKRKHHHGLVVVLDGFSWWCGVMVFLRILWVFIMLSPCFIMVCSVVGPSIVLASAVSNKTSIKKHFWTEKNIEETATAAAKPQI